MTIASLQAKYASGEVTPHAMICSLLDQIESAPLQPIWISIVDRERALASLDVDRDLPLYGVPFAVKDNIDVAEMQTTAGCPAFAYTARRSAPVVDTLQQAGAVLIGKTNLDQFATGLSGTRSPYGVCSSAFDGRYISGGSSSGSALAVASGLVCFALGTDTAGSGRVPAAFNNLIGLKPSRGLLSTAGVVPACRSLDCVSIFAHDCADASFIFDLLRDQDLADSAAPQIIGIPPVHQLEFFGNQAFAALYAETADALRSAGYLLTEFDVEPFLQAGKLLYQDAFVAERFAAVGDFIASYPDEVNATVRDIILGAGKWSAADLFRAQYKLAELKLDTSFVWQQAGALLLPTAPTTCTIAEMLANPLELNARLGRYTNFVNLLELCAVAVPAGFTATGLPFGVSVIAPAMHDRALLQLADDIHKLRGKALP